MDFSVARYPKRFFAVRGELDHASAPMLLEEVRPFLDEPGNLTVDLSGLTFVDASGMQAVVRIAEDLRDGIVVLRYPGDRVARRVLQSTDIVEHVNIRLEGQAGA